MTESRLECLTESKSSISGMRNNSVDRFLPVVKERSISSEGIDWETDNDIRGGTIVFPSETGAERLLDEGSVNSIKQIISTARNRVDPAKPVGNAANVGNPPGWTVGHNYDGRYMAKKGKGFDGDSTTLDIAGISDEDLVRVATDICKSLRQECVLLRLAGGKVCLIGQS